MAEQNNTEHETANDIAIVGMAAHLPGSPDLETYWQNLRDGISSIQRLSEDDLRKAGVSAGLSHHKDHVPYAAKLEGFDQFDSEFFGLSPKDAAIMDPQHRHFLECSWEALENAGHVPENFDGRIGVYGGCGMGSYFYFNLCSHDDLVENTGLFLLRHTGNDKDFLTTRVSHIFDLDGPSVGVQTACSTSLVAIHYACQSLLNGECDMALAGGVTIELPQGQGYLFKENEILSPDGKCHAFDHRAQGTVFGSGAGVVVLRRLDEAIADGDHIWAVIKGTAVNNDGSAKAGYLAPSVEGQATAVSEAHSISGITADTVDYVECHGTGTYLGDPIEVAALTQAFRETTDQSQYCRIGSVKTNIGHLDTAAGVASVIKASLALHHAEMPPSLGFEAPNPAIDFEHSPFRVNDRLTEWPSTGHPRRAGVNSLGVGGTNAHAILEQAPERSESEEGDWPFQILTLSGRSKAALEGNAAALAQHLRNNPDQRFEDVAWTLKEGRRAFERRRVVVASSHEDAADLLDENNIRRVHTHTALDNPDFAFLFPGGGAQYVSMGRDLYETEPVFAEWMDRGLEHLAKLESRDIRALWCPEEGDEEAAEQALRQPSLQLPLIMIVEYALAQLWMSWGIRPAVLAGHSMGENTAACVAGVIGFEDCIGLVHLRGRLFDRVDEGGMLSVALSADDLKPHLGDSLDLAAINGPNLSVASGPKIVLQKLEAELKKLDIDCQSIAIDVAAHSRMLEPILGEFRAYLEKLDLNPPQIPIISNREGEVLSDADATNPDYWVGHLRGTVAFADCLETLADRRNRIFLEVGPGKALSALARQGGSIDGQQVLSSLRHPDEVIDDDRYLLEVLGRVWALGGEFDWDQIWGDAARQKVVLPTYAFQRSQFFIEPATIDQAKAPKFLTKLENVSEWAWTPVWRPKYADVSLSSNAPLADLPQQSWLVFMDDAGLSERVVAELKGAGHPVIEVWPGDKFTKIDDTQYVLSPERGREGYDQLARDLMARGVAPSRVAHFWGVTKDKSHRPGSSFFHRIQEQGFYSLMFLAQAIAEEGLPKPLHINVFTNDAVSAPGSTLEYPEKAILTGPVRVIPREFEGVTASSLDVTLPKVKAPGPLDFLSRADEGPMDQFVEAALEELLSEPDCQSALVRDDTRFVLEYAQTDFGSPESPAIVSGGTYLITGGLGGIGLSIAKRLAEENCNIVLVGRTELPPKADWETYLQRHAPSDPVSTRIRAVEELDASGAVVTVESADVCNFTQMNDLAQRITDRVGKINGVIHAAGAMDDAPIATKTTGSVETVFSAKIHGTDVLDRVFPDGSLDWFVVFSSVSTVTAPIGQVDYVAANEYLNAFVAARANCRTKYRAINWGIWNEVGMAANAIAERTGALDTVPEVEASAPLLSKASFDPAGHRMFTARYSEADWFIDEHRTKFGDALFPGAGYISMASQALRGHGETAAFEMQDLTFLRALNVPKGSGRDVRVRLARSREGYRFEVLGDVMSEGQKGFVPVATADLVLGSDSANRRVDLDGLRARCEARETARAGQKLLAPQEAQLQFGERWRVLDTYRIGHGEGVAELSLGPVAQTDQGYDLHPALLDIATGWAMELIDGYRSDALWVPVTFGSVQVLHPLPERVVSWVKNAAPNRNEDETASFDIELMDENGNVCVSIRGFSIKKLADVATLKDPVKASAAEFEPEDLTKEARPLSPAEERLHHNMTQGITPNEGVDAFFRALNLEQSQILVTSLDLHSLIAQAGETSADNQQTQSFERPQLDADYAAPETDIERTLAGFWEELLGVKNVGVEDSFFDLGGHSLIAVRLFSKVRRTYDVEFPISILFEAPTIRACANLIADRVGDVPETGDVEKPKKRERRFKHIVAMHDGEGGTKQPFFLVAGMFGNVLNLRHLAQLLGKDRPFYGLQARGLYGDEEPHRSISDAARDYIAEMKQVQPEGPYFLGGFSGGGITAFEIAQQLEAMGDEVAIIVLLDTPLPQRRPLSRKDRLLIQLQETRRKGVGYPFVWLRNRIAWEIEKRRSNQSTVQDHNFHNAEIEAAFLSAVAGYQMRSWDGRIVLFRPPLVGTWQVSDGRWVDHERAYLFEDNDWSQFTPQIDVHEVPGDHDSMVLEPNVRVLASYMREAILKAEASANGNGRVLSFDRIEAAE